MRVAPLLIAATMIACSADVSGPPSSLDSSSTALLMEPPPFEAATAAEPSLAVPVVDPLAEALGKAAHQDVVALVEWDAVARHPSIPASEIPPAAADAVASAPIPTLVPSDPELVDSSVVFAGQDWVATQHDGPGFTVEVFGTRRAFSRPQVVVHELDRVVEGRPLFTRSEGIPFVSFTRFGVAYRISIECTSGPTDVRCAEFDAVTELFDGLVVVDGGQR